MSTFINPVKIRELAATGDQFYKGAAWVLDQQDAARTSPDRWADYAPLFSPEELAARRRYRDRKKAQSEEGGGDWTA